ncbi:tRNA-dihydrouridine(47) synthase [NAD(P)(+)]-like isoform X1 [Juglans microcarpa x Juglans regia]|uniref:tRNA-dihydrouridine(47) synthase [NAD(P)(+)]-like isoform X1 n=1 Tax=Juglans microcarpa x Juglans regia TaxID=2249226 RepID=UPI001B7DB08C|nr:tRNA-dihydrouridine(47) synthase [NAD(P)(+)]-like isoform X1 [Juglans microcarpa x Juglans regia]
MDESPAETVVDPKLSGDDSPSLKSNGSQRTPEELVAKAIAPVKKEFLRSPPPRPSSSTNHQTHVVSETKVVSIKEKKSKRQLKRERRQEQKSARSICPLIAKTGDVSSCPYNDKCRFSHDLQGFKDQKPVDLVGECPFMTAEGPCPYGLACRFFGTHKDGVPTGISDARKKCAEINGLKKDVQKLLWKNKMSFPKADAKLKALGLLGKAKSKMKILEVEKDDETVPSTCHETDENGCSAVNNESDAKLDSVDVPGEDGVDGTLETDEQPPKKQKSVICENFSSAEAKNGDMIFTEKNVGISCTQTKPEDPTDIIPPEADRSLKLHPREKKLIDFRDKLYLAPLTTVGNLPFRRVCKVLGADVTCGEMAMCTNLLQGQASEWALLRRHSSEDLFGVQICGAYPDTVARAIELIDQECTVDFIDINMGCPIDIVVDKGAGSALLTKPMRIKSIIDAASGTVDKPITVKVRTGFFEGKNRIDSLIKDIGYWGTSAVTIHGRSRQQRYSKLANWDYIYQCARKAPDDLQVLGNGDVFSYLDWNMHKTECPVLATCMIARGALIKPWIFTEIKEQKHWDISSGERLTILKDFVRFGLEHWGSDTKGVETTRRFLLEWLSYTCRYIPVGLLDVVPQQLNWRPPTYMGRDDLETLMASDSAADWIRISEMLLGKVPDGFTFAPKHKSNAYDRAENG